MCMTFDHPLHILCPLLTLSNLKESCLPLYLFYALTVCDYMLDDRRLYNILGSHAVIK